MSYWTQSIATPQNGVHFIISVQDVHGRFVGDGKASVAHVKLSRGALGWIVLNLTGYNALDIGTEEWGEREICFIVIESEEELKWDPQKKANNGHSYVNKTPCGEWLMNYFAEESGTVFIVCSRNLIVAWPQYVIDIEIQSGRRVSAKVNRLKEISDSLVTKH